MQVLSSDPAAPSDLREKATRVAGHILEYDPGLRGGAGTRVLWSCWTLAQPWWQCSASSTHRGRHRRARHSGI